MKNAIVLVFLATAFTRAFASTLELTKDTWDSETAGKAVFVKFFAPWCGHCKSMKPAWDQLAEEYKESQDYLIVDVNCDLKGHKSFCSKNGAKGFPTLKYGDPGNLEKYEGPRDFDSLKKHVENVMVPICSPFNEGNCDEDQKALIKTYASMSVEGLDADIETAKEDIKKANKERKQAIKALENDFAAYQKEKAGVISLMKLVYSNKGNGKDEL